PLEDGALTIAHAQEVAEHLPEVLTQEWEWVLKKNEDFAQWLSRLSFLIRSKDKVADDILQQKLCAFDESVIFTEEQKREAFTLASMGEKDFNVVSGK